MIEEVRFVKIGDGREAVSEYVKLPPEPSRQFTKMAIQTNMKATGYCAWIAIWVNRGRGHVIVGAPTLDDLAARWEQITNSDFDRSAAQRVYLCSEKVASHTNLGTASSDTTAANRSAKP